MDQMVKKQGPLCLEYRGGENMTKQISLHLSDEQFEKISKIAKSDDRNIQYVIRKYIDSL